MHVFVSAGVQVHVRAHACRGQGSTSGVIPQGVIHLDFPDRSLSIPFPDASCDKNNSGVKRFISAHRSGKWRQWEPEAAGDTVSIVRG